MTASAKDWNERRNGPTGIGGERRGDRRYELQLDIQWKLVHRRRVLDSGTGRTRDISSHGILFETGRALPSGSHLEVAVAWPALLHGTAQMKLIADGHVVRSDQICTAIRMTRHEFRTAGIPADRAMPLAAANASIPLWNIRGNANVLKFH
jgi:hypothetical protein